jgi:hypothetical protein
MRRNPARWRTRFGRWVIGYSTSGLSRDYRQRGYSVSQSAIIHWVAGRTTPRPAHARLIVQLSHHQLSLDDIYRQRAQHPPTL